MEDQLSHDHPEEIANAITHGIGLLIALFGAVFLLAAAVRRGTPVQVLACTLYGATLVMTYLFSTLSHVLPPPRQRNLMRAADQAAIFLFIAGTYTPMATTYLKSPAWWLLTAAVWCVAIFGFLRKAVWTHRVELGTVSTILYVLLGLLPAPMFFLLPIGLLKWVITGGLCYLMGLLFFSFDHRIRYFHAAWHLLVFAGSVCHFLGILLYCTALPARMA